MRKFLVTPVLTGAVAFLSTALLIVGTASIRFDADRSSRDAHGLSSIPKTARAMT